MKDSLYLIGTGLIMSVFAWAFWHYSGQNGFEIFSILIMVSLAVDNFRLRRLLRSKGGL